MNSLSLISIGSQADEQKIPPHRQCFHVVRHTRRHPKMKEILLTIALLFTISTFEQTRSELANSKLYVRGTYFDKKNVFIGLQTRTDLSDTIINSNKYKKIQAEDFTDYSD